MYPIRAGLALVLALTLNVGIVVRGQDNEHFKRTNPDQAADQRFPWLCFATSIAAIVGLYVVVRRREQAVESDLKKGRGPRMPWYCRACDRDVVGPECPHCHAPDPFQHDSGDGAKTSRSQKSS
jgi:hypothetical protein